MLLAGGGFPIEPLDDEALERVHTQALRLLAEVGALRIRQEVERGGISLPIPEQEIEPDGPGWRLVLRSQPPVEEYNAQLSLLTGRAAAKSAR